MCPKQNRAWFMSQNQYKIHSIPPDEYKQGHNVTDHMTDWGKSKHS